MEFLSLLQTAAMGKLSVAHPRTRLFLFFMIAVNKPLGTRILFE